MDSDDVRPSQTLEILGLFPSCSPRFPSLEKVEMLMGPSAFRHLSY